MSEGTVQPQQLDDEMVVCQFCKKETPAEFNFCAECDSQIKCTNCGRKTYPGKDYCLACSKPLIVRAATAQAPNQYERSVKQEGENYEEHTRFALSDDSVKAIAPFVINQTMPGFKGRVLPPRPAALPDGQGETVDTTYEEEPSGESSNEPANDSAKAAKPASAPSDSPLSKFFELDGDTLAAKENDFKGITWAAQQRNFILLYTKAHKDLLGKPVPDKEAYKAPAIKLKLLDPTNYTTYVNKQVSAYMTAMTNGLVLNTAGEKEVAKVIQLMEDESKTGESYWSRPSSPAKPASILTKDDKDKVLQWVADSSAINLGRLDIRDVSIARDYALLSLWLIIHHLKKADAVKWNEAMMFLTSYSKNTAVSGGSFSKAMASKENEKYFTKNGEGLYFLTTAGQQLVEEWVAGTKSVKAKKDSTSS